MVFSLSNFNRLVISGITLCGQKTAAGRRGSTANPLIVTARIGTIRRDLPALLSLCVLIAKAVP